MTREAERQRLVKLLYDGKLIHNSLDNDARAHYLIMKLTDYLLDKGVIVPPCKVGETLYYVSNSPMSLSVEANTVYEAHITRIVTTQYGTTLVIQIHNSYGCTEIPDINDWGKTVFLTREEALAELGGKEDA